MFKVTRFKQKRFDFVHDVFIWKKKQNFGRRMKWINILIVEREVLLLFFHFQTHRFFYHHHRFGFSLEHFNQKSSFLLLKDSVSILASKVWFFKGSTTSTNTGFYPCLNSSFFITASLFSCMKESTEIFNVLEDILSKFLIFYQWNKTLMVQ